MCINISFHFDLVLLYFRLSYKGTSFRIESDVEISKVWIYFMSTIKRCMNHDSMWVQTKGKRRQKKIIMSLKVCFYMTCAHHRNILVSSSTFTKYFDRWDLLCCHDMYVLMKYFIPYVCTYPYGYCKLHKTAGNFWIKTCVTEKKKKFFFLCKIVLGRFDKVSTLFDSINVSGCLFFHNVNR